LKERVFVSTPNAQFAAKLKPIYLAVGVVAVALLLTLFAAPAMAGGGIGTGSGGGGGGGGKASSTGGSKYSRLWDRVSERDKRWASKTAKCESGKDPNAIGGGGMYRGAFQFMKSTWRASPKSPGGDPIAFNYKTQAVVAVALKNRDGAGHWPVCG
jgi:hypothetical protein